MDQVSVGRGAVTALSLEIVRVIMISDHALVTQTISSGDFTAYSGSNTVLDITPIGGAANSSVELTAGDSCLLYTSDAADE